MIVFKFLLVLISLFLISLNIKKHKKQFFKKYENEKALKELVYLGWFFLCISMVWFIYIYDVGVGITYWFGTLGVCSFILAVVYGRIKTKSKKI